MGLTSYGSKKVVQPLPNPEIVQHKPMEDWVRDHVVQPENKRCATKKDAQWWKEYRLRNKNKPCIHCGKNPKK